MNEAEEMHDDGWRNSRTYDEDYEEFYNSIEEQKE